jgi:hypothetical protein
MSHILDTDFIADWLNQRPPPLPSSRGSCPTVWR